MDSGEFHIYYKQYLREKKLERVLKKDSKDTYSFSYAFSQLCFDRFGFDNYFDENEYNYFGYQLLKIFLDDESDGDAYVIAIKMVNKYMNKYLNDKQTTYITTI